MDYIIKRTDTVNNGQFTIKPFTTNGPAVPSAETPLAPHSVSANTSLVLLGKGMFEYGESVASDFVHLLENFSNATAPVYPIQGQLWYKNDTKELFLYHSEDDPFTFQQIIINGKLTSPLDVNTQRIINVGLPTDNTDAVSKIYLETNFLSNSGNLTFTGDLTISTGAKLLLTDLPVTDVDGTNKLYVDTADIAVKDWTTTNFVSVINDTITGNLTIATGGHIILIDPPTISTHATNKLYVDNTIISSGSKVFVRKEGSIISGPLVIDGTVGLPIWGVNATVDTFTIDNGDYTSVFVPGLSFTIINDTLLLTPTTFTVEYSSFDTGSNRTLIKVIDDVPSNIQGDGMISGSVYFKSSPIIMDTSLTVSGVHLLDFGSNKLTNISSPTDDNDAVTKQYVDTAIGGIVVGGDDGYLSGGSFDSTTNTITLTSTSGVADVVIPGIASSTQTYNTNQLNHNVYAPSITTSSRLRQTLSGSANYPNLTVETVLNQIDKDLNYLRHRNDRYIVETPNITLTAVSLGLSGNLPISAITPLTPGHQDITFTTLASSGSPTMLVSGTTYTATVLVDGTFTKNISILGSTALTFDTLIDQLNVDLGTAAVATIDVAAKKIIITSTTGGSSSAISITAGTLFAAPLAYYNNLSGAVAGTNNTITIATTNYTTTFNNPGLLFTVTGNGHSFSNITYTVLSATYSTNTIITIASSPDIPLAVDTVTRGSIVQSYGALKVAGDKTKLINTGSKIATVGNAVNANYTVASANVYSGNTYFYMSSTSPLSLSTTVAGTIQLWNYVLPFDFLIESNKLQVYNAGLKKMKHARGQYSLKFTTNINENTNTGLINGTYSFNISVNGTTNVPISIVVNQTTNAITAVDLVNNTWTVASGGGLSFPINSVFTISGNTGLTVPVSYTVSKVVDDNTNIVITVKETISGLATNDGTIRYPYTVLTLIQDMNTQFTANAPLATAFLEDYNIVIISTTDGITNSTIGITDIDLIPALVTTLGNCTQTKSDGITREYSEVGVPFTTGNTIEFYALPTAASWLEFINTR